MTKISSTRVSLAVVVGLLMACASSSSKRDAVQAPRSDDLLELLTGFGESLSKRNFARAVDYMVPEEKALMLEGGSVPVEKQKMLLALPLQKLIRHPAVRVENGHIAGIYSVLPNLRQGDANPMAMTDESATPAGDMEGDPMAAAESKGPMANGSTSESPEANEDMSTAQAYSADVNDPQLKSTVNKFFSAVNKRNWTSALAMMSEGEKRMLLDEKGRLKESSKQRLSQIDQKNRDALILQDGKLSGVTLLLPSE
ncbi:MAG: hypothetical protein M3Y08_16120 [Fibrobacterota bacterium]|nr:hypothetical protein [Fibrobacterota bacterium]